MIKYVETVSLDKILIHRIYKRGEREGSLSILEP